MVAQMEEHGPPNRIDRTFLSGMSGAGQTQFMHGLRSLGLIDEDGKVQPRLAELVGQSDDRPALVGQILREHYPEAVELGKGNATTGELVEVFKSYGVQGDTARKAIAFYLAAARYAEDIPISPSFKTPASRSGPAGRKRQRPPTSPTPSGSTDNGQTDIPTGLHPALAGLLGDIPKRGHTWTQAQHDNFMEAFKAVLRIGAPIADEPEHDPDEEEDS
jgi:hypothetical protein